VSLEHTLFLDFLKLFVNMRLVVSFAGKQKTHYLDLRIKSYGCMKFQGEVWAGRACAAANEEELTACAKFCGQGGWARGAGVDKVGHPCWGGRRPLVGAADRAPTSGWRPWIARDGRPPVGKRSPVRRPPVGLRLGVAACIGCDCGCCAIFFYLFFKKKGDIFFSFFSGPCM
jgi:hypothetical protein